MKVTNAAAMHSVLGHRHQKFQNSGPSAACALWPVDLRITHLDWNPEATLIHFQGQYLTICELDYNILQGEIQSISKTKTAVDIGEFCLVEDLTSARWYRGRVQNRKEDMFDVFLIDHGNILSVDITNISSCSNDLFILPPKIVCGFLANVLLLQGCPHSVVEEYFSKLIGRNVTGYIQALLPHKVLLLEAPDINNNLVRHGFGRHVDTDTFLLLVEMLTEVPFKQNVEPVPDLLIEKPRGQEFCFKLPGLGYEDILSFCGPRLRCGTRAKVRVTAAVNPGLFYCQIAGMETDLLEMSKKLAAVCEYRTKEPNQRTPENLGMLCSVKGKDEKWYRGLVQFLPVNSQVRVFFIDYGFFESVRVENVHRLPSDFDSTPLMAFPCSPFSLSDQDEAVKAQQLSFLKAGLLGKVLDMEIRSFDEHIYSVMVHGAEENPVKELEPNQEPPKIKIESGDVSPQGGHLYQETIMCEALGKTLEAEEVQVDSVFVGFVEYVQDPNHFWIRTQKRNNDFKEMMTQIKDHFSQVKMDEDVLLSPELGMLCCAVYKEDMHFYRGVVTDTLEHGAEVLFIDFGNIEKVPHMLIKKIPKVFASKPAFAFCCSLVNVLPLDDIWTSATSNFFRRAVTNKALLVHVVHMRRNKFVVDLYETGSDNNPSVTELLISEKQAEYWNNIPIVLQNHTDVTDERSGTSDVKGNTEQLEDWEEKKKTCKDIEKAQDLVCFKALGLKPGCEFAVCCSNVNSPSDFWCQSLDKVPALEELMEKVQLYYSTHTVNLKPEDSCCVAKSPQDGRWYRAFITEKQKGHARVLLVDYGYNIQIEWHNIQAIMPEFVHLEGQAFRCSIYNLIEPADPKNCDNWSLEVCNSLKDFVHNSTCGLRCKVLSQVNVENKGLCNVVDLYNTQANQSITNLLLDQGLAGKVTIPTTQPSTVFPESFVFSSFDQSPGSEEQVYVTHISSQWEVYYHLERNTDIIEELEKKIADESEKMMTGSTRAVVRELCLAKYLDGKWYRGYAHPVQSPLHLSVYFVDYGNTNISEKTQVMFIPRDSVDLLYTPMQAVKCHLASVSKKELYADVKEWLDGTILSKQVRAVIVGKNEDGSLEVELFDGDINVNEKVKELILSRTPQPNAVVTFDRSGPKGSHKTLHTKNAKLSVECASKFGGYSSNSSAPKSDKGTQVGSTPWKKKENTKIEVRDEAESKNTKIKQQNEGNAQSCVPAKPQKDSQEKHQRENHATTTKSEQPHTTDETEIPQLSCLPDMKVTEGFRAKCFVSHIDSVNSFFLQLSEDEPAILKIAEDLNSNNSRDTLKATTSLRTNGLVLAEYEEDGALYRSAVKAHEGSFCFTVEFIDYGNSAVVEKEKIYSIPKEYVSQPRFSIPCSLLDTSIYKSDSFFTDAFMERPLMVDFVSRCGNQWKVKVESLDVTVPAPLEAAVDGRTEKETEEGDPASSTETEDSVSSCEQNYRRKGASENETTKSKTEITTVNGENSAGTTSTGNESVPENDQRKKTVQAKDTENCTVLSVLSDGNFYVRLNRTSDLISTLERCIADNRHRCKVVAEEDIRQGQYYLVQVHKDQQWHRAVVQHLGQGKSQVLLIDHGITEDIPSCSIRQQCEAVTRIQKLAVLCRVNSFDFSEEEDARKSWCEMLRPVIGKTIKLVFVSYSEADYIWEVDIIMNELFLARPITTLPQPNEEKIPPPAQNEKAEGKLDTSQPQQLVVAPVDIDVPYSCFAAAVTTPFEFSVVPDDSLLVMNELSIMLDDLPEQMCPLPEAHLIPGTSCLLKSETKNKWCRAEIVHSDTTVTVNMVDYGHCECIAYENCSKLKRLPVEITNLPKVTYPCTLRGVKPVRADGQWSDEAAVFFQQCLFQKNLQIFFREFVSNTHWMVDLLADDVHVAKELVDAGHANFIDNMLGLRFQEQSPCKAAPHGSDSEDKCHQEDEESDRSSDLSFQSTDEPEEMPHSVVSGFKQCFVM